MQAEVIVNIYISIFGVIVTIFGISIAAIIALAQVLQPVIHHSQIIKLLKNRFMCLLLLLMTISTLLCLGAITLLAYPHNIFPSSNLGINAYPLSLIYFIVTLLFIFSAIVLTVYVIYQQSSLMTPTNALNHFRKGINSSVLKKYLQYISSEKPMPPINLIFFKENSDKEEDEEAEEAVNKEYREKLADYKSIQESGKNLENPLLPLESYLSRNLSSGDLVSFTATLATFNGIVREFIEDEGNKNYALKLTAYYSKVLERICESASGEGSASFVYQCVESSREIAQLLVNLNPLCISNIQSFWQNLALDTMGRTPIIYKQLLDAYRELGIEMISSGFAESDNQDETGAVENIFRSVGWLGEMYLTKYKPESKQIMMSDYQTEFDFLAEALLSFGWEYSSRHSKGSYPLIYFDALYVVIKRLMKYYESEDSTPDIHSTLFSLMYEHLSYGEAACRDKNDDGAWLAMRGLKSCLEIFSSNKSSGGLIKETLDAVLRLGCYAYVNGLTKPTKRISLDAIHEYGFKILDEYATGIDLSNEAHEIFVKSATGNFDATEEYLKLASSHAITK